MEERDDTGGEVARQSENPGFDSLLDFAKDLLKESEPPRPAPLSDRASEVAPDEGEKLGEVDAEIETLRRRQEFERSKRGIIDHNQASVRGFLEGSAQRGRWQYFILKNQWNKLQGEVDTARFSDYFGFYNKQGGKHHIDFNMGARYETGGFAQGPDNRDRVEKPIETPNDFVDAARELLEKNQKAVETAPDIDVGTFRIALKKKYDDLFRGDSIAKSGLAGSKENADAYMNDDDLARSEFEVATFHDSQNTGKAFFERTAQQIRRTVEGFSDTAFDDGDLGTAISGYDMAGILEKPDTLGKIEGKMRALKNSPYNREAREQLSAAVEKLEEIKLRKEAEKQINSTDSL